MRIGQILLILAITLVVGPGCSRIGRLVSGGDESAFPSPGIPRELQKNREVASPLARVSVEGGTALPDMGRQAGGAVAGGPPLGGFTADEDIVWTNPDDPDAELPGLEEALAVAKKTGPWEVSYTVAKTQAMREGKPMLIWFTDTMRSPLCKFLSAEVFSTPAFEDWAGENIVRVRLDFNVKGDTDDERLRRKDYMQALKKRYKATGLPLVLIMAPDGTVTGRYRGYKKGAPEFYFGRLKSAGASAERHQKDWRRKMEKKGYRTWTGRRKGKVIFAKLLRYHDEELVLVEPDGRKFRASEANLSDGDRLWIKGELAKRGR